MSDDDIAVNDEPTGADLSDALDPRGHRINRRCPGCEQSVMANAITTLAYSYERCTCGDPEYLHLVERPWHLICLADKAADLAAIDQLRSASYVLLGTTASARRNVKAATDTLIDRLTAPASLPQENTEGETR